MKKPQYLIKLNYYNSIFQGVTVLRRTLWPFASEIGEVSLWHEDLDDQSTDIKSYLEQKVMDIVKGDISRRLGEIAHDAEIEKRQGDIEAAVKEIVAELTKKVNEIEHD